MPCKVSPSYIGMSLDSDRLQLCLLISMTVSWYFGLADAGTEMSWRIASCGILFQVQWVQGWFTGHTATTCKKSWPTKTCRHRETGCRLSSPGIELVEYSYFPCFLLIDVRSKPSNLCGGTTEVECTDTFLVQFEWILWSRIPHLFCFLSGGYSMCRSGVC